MLSHPRLRGSDGCEQRVRGNGGCKKHHPTTWKYRKLRIAWSVGWGIVAVLLVVLWARSYRWVEQLMVPISNNGAIGLGAMPGNAVIVINQKWGRPPWTKLSNPADEWLALGGYSHSRIWGFFEIKATAVVIPFWCSLVVVATIASIVWVRQLRWRFSLRTLLFATTLVAVVLGLIVWALGKGVSKLVVVQTHEKPRQGFQRLAGG